MFKTNVIADYMPNNKCFYLYKIYAINIVYTIHDSKY